MKIAKVDALDVVPTAEKLPAYIRKASKVKCLCFGGFDHEGKMRKDIGAAVMRNGDIIPFWWGDKLTLEECKKIRKQDHKSNFLYIGRVWDADHGSRDNFARIISF
jgi:hypothetical protein